MLTQCCRWMQSLGRGDHCCWCRSFEHLFGSTPVVGGEGFLPTIVLNRFWISCIFPLHSMLHIVIIMLSRITSFFVWFCLLYCWLIKFDGFLESKVRIVSLLFVISATVGSCARPIGSEALSMLRGHGISVGRSADGLATQRVHCRGQGRTREGWGPERA